MRKLTILFVLLLMGGMQVVFAQKTIRGKVTSSGDGTSIPGAAVAVPGTTVGVVTDVSGNFTLTVPANAKTLRISFVGMKTQEVKIGSQTELKVVLESATTELDELVVVGYGALKKSDLTGSISSVKGNDLVELPTMDATQSLQGRAAGVVINNNDGEPGGNTTIRIRGSNTVAGSSDPLIVVDGFQGGNLDKINPNDIASIEVLKDASATAIYGSRGANGVILVTTKVGTTGETIVDFSLNAGVQNVSHKVSMMKAGDYARKTNAWWATQTGYVDATLPNNGLLTPPVPYSASDIAAFDKSGGTDWQNAVMQAGTQNTFQFSVRGGNEKSKYFLSAGYLDQQGIIINTHFKRLSIRANTDTQVKKWLKLGLNVNVVKDDGNVPASGDGTWNGDVMGQTVNQALRADPTMPVKNADGSWGTANTLWADPDIWNPVQTTYTQTKDLQNRTVNMNTYALFNILPGLTLRIEGALGLEFDDSWEYYSSTNFHGAQFGGDAIINNGKSEFWQNSNILTYDKTIKKHHFTLTGVAEQSLSKSTALYDEPIGFSSDITGVYQIGGSSGSNGYSSSVSTKALNSYMARAFYSYNDRYMLTATIRADGSSVFGVDNKWGYFPSVSLGWIASKEDFIKNLNVFSELKFRASSGTTGNQSIAPYQTLPGVGPGGRYAYDGISYSTTGYSVGLANPGLKWESTQQNNLGVDMEFLKGRLYGSVDVYKKITSNLLFPIPLPIYTGFTSHTANIGQLSNRGIEVMAGGKILTGKFKWSTTFTLGHNRGVMDKISNGVTNVPIRTNAGSGYAFWGNSGALKNFTVGKDIGTLSGWKTLGTWKTTEATQAAVYHQMPGDQKFLDVNNDGKIDQNDVTTIGNVTPKFTYGWSNNMSYQSFNLTFLIQGTEGNDVFNATRIKIEDPQFGYSSALNNRWTPTNQNTMIPGFIDNYTRDQQGMNQSGISYLRTANSRNRQSRYVEDGSYARLKSVTLGYNLPKAILNQLHITNFRVYIAGTNLLTLTKYTGFDPEINSFRAQGNYGGNGIDMSGYPTARTYSLGLNLTF